MLLIALACLAGPPAARAQGSPDAAGLVSTCSTSNLFCPDALQMFLDAWADAWRGDLRAQRNVAFCLGYGCDEAVRIDKVKGCAWRMLIVQSGHAEADDSDTMSFVTDCDQLSGDDQSRASAYAAELRAAILKP